MNNREAREILLRYRPGTADGDDSDVAEALLQVQQDPELTRWFDEQMAVQTTIRSRFKEIQVPDGLKEQILSETRAALQRADDLQKHATPPKAQALAGAPKLRRAVVFGVLAAACLFLVIGLVNSYLLPHEDKTFAGFRDQMAQKVTRGYPPMDLFTSDLGQIRKLLAEKHSHGDYILPGGLSKASATGCAIFRWQDHLVSMVCFDSGHATGPMKSDVFLFVIDRSAVAKAPAGTAPVFTQTDRLSTASWSKDGKTYILGGYGDLVFLKQYL
jgi:hypothetical protein